MPNFLSKWPHHISHRRMFEERVDIKNKINPESISPHNLTRPDLEGSVEYEDTPEFRKSLNMPEVSQLIDSFFRSITKSFIVQ